jgi:hypothetical protein
MTADQIIEEVKRLDPEGQKRVALSLKSRALTPEELGELARQLAGETDPLKVEALQHRLTTGFYGEEFNQWPVVRLVNFK